MIEQLREKASRLPLCPGVYIMLDKSGEVIYVGKAKKLKNRVSSYFRDSWHDAKTTAMVSKVNDFNFIVADTEFEALVLENSLIKRYMPHYNILLKDDKGYPFIRLDKNTLYPRFTVAAKREEDGAMYFGPYGGRSITKDAIDTVCRVLKLPTCSRKFPRDIGKARPCLNKHMGLCNGYCQLGVPYDEYKNAIDDAVMVFEGNVSALKARLKAEMEKAADELRFELAAEKRDKLKAVSALSTKQRIISGAMADTDAIGFYRGQEKCCFVVMHYISGTLFDKDYMLLEVPVEMDKEAVSLLLRSYYLPRGVYPKNILLPMETEDEEVVAELFLKECGRKVNVVVPQKGYRKKLVDTANANAREETLRTEDKEKRVLKSLLWLKENLSLSEIPSRIESYDISNISGTDNVASMVVFKDGKALKKDYRKFKIKGIAGQDDYGSMREVLRRRFVRMLEGDSKFDTPPQLLLIDGGRAHVGVVYEVLSELGLSIPAFGMVKDDRHRTRALVAYGGEEIGIEGRPDVFALVGNIQEKTHRFAIEYHKNLRSKRLQKSKLDEINGIGEKRKSVLLKAFGSVDAIGNAKVEELEKVIPKSAAAEVYKYFHNRGGKGK